MYEESESSPSVDVCVQSSAPLLEGASATLTTSDISATGTYCQEHLVLYDFHVFPNPLFFLDN